MLKSFCFYFHLLHSPLFLFWQQEKIMNFFFSGLEKYFSSFSLSNATKVLVMFNNYKFYLVFTGAWIGFNRNSVSEHKNDFRYVFFLLVQLDEIIDSFVPKTSNRTNSENKLSGKALFVLVGFLSAVFTLTLQAPRQR